jgi:hypothetical protein
MVVAVTIVALSAGFASAQSEAKTGRAGGWDARALRAGVVPDAPAPAPPSAPPAARAERAAAKAKGLTGTWRVSIPQSDAGLPPFNAYHTFHADGTFTEVSDLLATQTESPAHGVWSGEKTDYQLTFELFVFDPETKAPAGRVRVRCAIRLSGDGDTFAADSVVDFIAPDGSVAEGIDSGPFSGTRVKVVPNPGT